MSLMATSAERDRLAERVEWALRRVSQSWGHADTARQVVDAISDLFPGEAEAARQIQTLTAERDSALFQADTAKAQMRAHVARSQRPVNRFEVIDYRADQPKPARILTECGPFIYPVRQDNGDTLKVFISDSQLSLPPND